MDCKSHKDNLDHSDNEKCDLDQRGIAVYGVQHLFHSGVNAATSSFLLHFAQQSISHTFYALSFSLTGNAVKALDLVDNDNFWNFFDCNKFRNGGPPNFGYLFP
mmetsp:Transcript_30543/g.33353  ORF Transcript_30543/g.33353 Transcript_30543/m.33353 type:complete len:104 (-) Transcript_30543:110-421(-)